MPQGAPLNSSAPGPAPEGPWSRAAGMRAKLYRWAAAGPGRRLDDLFNLVHDPATLLVAFSRAAGNQGANAPGADGVTAGHAGQVAGVPGFLDDLRAALKDGSFRPLPVREKMIPKWRRKRGTSKHYVFAFIDDRPARSLKAKTRALTPGTSQLDTEYVPTRLNQVMHGWANYFRHAVAKDTFSMLGHFAWWRVTRMLTERHHWRWKDVRRWLVGPAGAWRPVTAGRTELRPIAAIPVTRYRYRGSQVPSPWTAEPA